MKSTDSLNPEQRRAVENTEGPVCIVAGPGTGKTKTLISRILYLVGDKKVPAEKILAVTFTKKAAAEIKERLSQSFAGQLPTVTTFHGLGYEALTARDGKVEIISDRRRREIAEEILQNLDEQMTSTVNELLLGISNYKNNLIHSSDSEYHKAAELYDSLLRQDGVIDYDDLLKYIYEHATQQFEYVMVDEFQDTNELQYELVKRLTGKNICVIGDPLQSIYAFRGADETVFQKFKDDFPDAAVITLQTNYRSVAQIITVSAALFPDIPALTPSTSGQGSVSLIRTLNEYSEASKVLDEISAVMGGMDLIEAGKQKKEGNTTVRFSDFAVIYRTHKLSKVIAQKFEESGIPYQIVGGNGPYEIREAAFIIDCLEYLHSGNNSLLTDILSSPVAGIDKRQLTEYKKGKELRAATKLAKTIGSLHELQLTSSTRKVSELVDEIIARFHIEEQMNQLYSTLIRFDTQAGGLQQCVEYFQYLKEHEFYDKTADKVTLLTMHAAKGLEFSYVFICGFEDGIIPFIRYGKGDDSIDEERRLLYVALTRARRELMLFETKERNRKQTTVSRFKLGLRNAGLEEHEDEANEKIEKKREITRLKKSQMSLF